jgi:hypothetical protein
MKGHRKKGKSAVQEPSQDLEQVSLKVLIESLEDSLQFNICLDAEAFETYVLKKRLHWIENTQKASEHVDAGYRGIVQELQKQ